MGAGVLGSCKGLSSLEDEDESSGDLGENEGSWEALQSQRALRN